MSFSDMPFGQASSLRCYPTKVASFLYNGVNHGQALRALFHIKAGCIFGTIWDPLTYLEEVTTG